VAKFDRYLLSQLIVYFGFFSLVLVLVYWINQAVRLFDQLIANGNSALVFLEFSALTLPNVIAQVLPISAFAAAIYCANRLASESELVVVQSTGFSPYRLTRPVLVFGILVGLMLSVLTNYLVPASLTQLAERQAEIESNSTARFLREGAFFHPADGITFYIREISPDGTMSSMFLSDSRNAANQVTYTARQAVLVRGDDGPKLIMLDGMAQSLRLADQSMSTTRFSEFVFDIGPLLSSPGSGRRRANQMATVDLLWPSEQTLEQTRRKPATLMQIGHQRIAVTIKTAALAMIGFSTLLIGGFSRFGLWRQIFGAVVIFLLLNTLDNFAADIARRSVSSWPVMYLPSLVGFTIAAILLWVSARPALFSRRLLRWPA